MMSNIKTGIAPALAVAAALLVPTAVVAADLNYGGSMKDGYAAAPYSAPTIAGPCYLRGDVGYSWSGDPTGTYVGNAGGASPDVRGSSLDNGVMWEAGLGCGSGSRGLRGEVAVGFRTDRDYTGDVDIFVLNPIDPPIKTTLDSYTFMVNGYYDLGNYRGFVPYVGAGVGVALHDMGYVYIDHPLSPNPQHGDTKVDFAWQVMAGVGYQVSSNAILDIGYRYIDMGTAHSSTQDIANFNNPKLVVDDLTAHEFKVGLRYHFGTTSTPGYAPMK